MKKLSIFAALCLASACGSQESHRSPYPAKAEQAPNTTASKTPVQTISKEDQVKGLISSEQALKSSELSFKQDKAGAPMMVSLDTSIFSYRTILSKDAVEKVSMQRAQLAEFSVQASEYLKRSDLNESERSLWTAKQVAANEAVEFVDARIGLQELRETDVYNRGLTPTIIAYDNADKTIYTDPRRTILDSKNPAQTLISLQDYLAKAEVLANTQAMSNKAYQTGSDFAEMLKAECIILAAETTKREEELFAYYSISFDGKGAEASLTHYTINHNQLSDFVKGTIEQEALAEPAALAEVIYRHSQRIEDKKSGSYVAAQQLSALIKLRVQAFDLQFALNNVDPTSPDASLDTVTARYHAFSETMNLSVIKDLDAAFKANKAQYKPNYFDMVLSTTGSEWMARKKTQIKQLSKAAAKKSSTAVAKR